MQRLVLAALLALAAGAPALAADGPAGHAGHTAQGAPADAPLTEGVVKKVDKAGGKVTLTHGPLVNLDMPGMTMAFRVKDPTWLDQLKEGDKVRFRAELVKGAYTVVRLEKAP